MSVPTRSRPALVSALAFGLALVAGCDQPTGSTRPKSNAGRVAGVDMPEEQTPAQEPVKPREILGKRTQDVRDAEKEKKAGGVATSPKALDKGPYPLVGNPYVSIIGKAMTDQIDYALRLYQAENGEFPKTYEEFMEKIIKANNIALPTLPFYQEYAYDAPNHKLVIMEYPDRKKAAGYPE